MDVNLLAYKEIMCSYSFVCQAVKFINDLVVTTIIWAYYIVCYLLFVFPLHLCAYLFLKNHEDVFQATNHFFFKGFFLLVHLLIPKVSFSVSPEVKNLRSCIVVSNHLSYLDPLLFISVFRRHKTIVKPVFFRVPVFGWLLRSSGYIPAMGEDRFDVKAMEQMQCLRQYMESGGILFVFPEGRRSRDGKVGVLNKGAFKIARYCNMPLNVLLIKNTESLFPPGTFLFNSWADRDVGLDLVRTINPDKSKARSHIKEDVNLVRSLFRQV